ncbi:glycosyltransferase [Pedobacter miscanthi]|uniref:Glycosyltransferase n=1 Tax=Pedobacter miscanthi TaxID=2259170 RepID=A0A366KPH6_9SPHI|nr:glycosyltransferase [Pedobacter miscanthi]RBQ03561.1 glycosyltransferase [Pedobacter miscanthi]
MKILLFGEYSGFHYNLKLGLEKLGHQVKIASSGDGFKRLKYDISLGNSSKGVFGKFNRILKPFTKINDFKGFDVTQFVNSNPLTVFRANKWLYKEILSFSPKNFLSVCGDDPVFLDNLYRFNYHPYSALNNLDVAQIPNINKTYLDLHNTVVENVDGIIPVLLEYAIGYRNHKKKKNTIPLPLAASEHQYRDNIVKKKIHFFHGLNRPNFKGTEVIRAAMEKLADKYPNDVRITIAGSMSQKDYLTILSETNVVLDQCKSYSYAMNTLYSMAQGKIVMSGAEPEALSELNIPFDKCPIINIRPDVNQIYQELERILDQKKDIVDQGYKSRLFVEQYHNEVDIAQQYIKTWTS